MESQSWLFDTWAGLGRTLIVGVLAYLALVALVRVSGKRTLSKMNAFDLIVTVALGSTLATILLSKDTALAEGVVALALLIGMQFSLTWLSVRSEKVNQWVKAEPTMLAYNGKMLHGAMRRERFVEVEVLAAVRQAGFSSLDDVGAVILETDGSVSCVARSDHPRSSALTGVKNWDAVRDAADVPSGNTGHSSSSGHAGRRS